MDATIIRHRCHFCCRKLSEIHAGKSWTVRIRGFLLRDMPLKRAPRWEQEWKRNLRSEIWWNLARCRLETRKNDSSEILSFFLELTTAVLRRGLRSDHRNSPEKLIAANFSSVAIDKCSSKLHRASLEPLEHARRSAGMHSLLIRQFVRWTSIRKGEDHRRPLEEREKKWDRWGEREVRYVFKDPKKNFRANTRIYEKIQKKWMLKIKVAPLFLQKFEVCKTLFTF